nr:hypothetical protein [Xenorhabdus bovienii]
MFIQFTDECDLFVNNLSRGDLFWRELFNVRITVLMPILSTRPVSLTPEPFSAISTIFSFIPGLWPL